MDFNLFFLFFRLIQPDAKQKHPLFGFGSTRFRYTGRTNIQSQMASQLFEAPIASDKMKSKSADQSDFRNFN